MTRFESRTSHSGPTMFLRSDLDELLTCEAQPAISIYLPTHKAGRETRQDPIRLRNLLSEAAERLRADRRGPEVDGLIEPARRLLDDEEFWRHQEHGLAIFIAPGFHRIHKLPIEVPEELTIGRHFHIRRLLPILDSVGWCWVLTITGEHTRLYQGSRWALSEAADLDLPQGVQAIHGETEYQQQHYASPPNRPGVGSFTMSHAQSFGEAPEELRKTQLLQLLRRIATGAEPLIKRQPAPVVLVAQPEIQGNFRELAGWREMLPDGVQENPEAMSDEELQRKAWELFEPRRARSRDEVLGRLRGLIGTADPKATTRPEDIVKAAREGRVELLFLAPDTPVWGEFDEAANRIIVRGTAGEGDDDLLDHAAQLTLQQGGAIMLVDPSELPRSGLSAAILRY
jgi:hypothetical protein